MRTKSVFLLCLASVSLACAQKEAAPKDRVVEKEAPKSVAPTLMNFKKQSDAKSVAILYTSQVQGYVEPCGCTAEPLGGVARFAKVVKEAQAAYEQRVVLLDAGNLLFEKADDNLPADLCQAKARVDLLTNTYQTLGLEGTALGALDDVRGAGFRDDLLRSRQITTLGYLPDALSARKASMLYAPSKLVRRGEVVVGVTAARVNDENDLKKAQDFLAIESAALKKKGAHVVVLLSQATHAQTLRLVENTPWVDIAIVGKDPGEVPRAPALSASKTIVVAAGAQAQHMGVVEVKVGDANASAPIALDERETKNQIRKDLLQKRLVTYEKQIGELEEGERKVFVMSRAEKARAEIETLNAPLNAFEGPHARVRSIALGRAGGEDLLVQKDLRAYEEAIPTLVASCEENIECEPAADGAPTYVGVETCYTCHRGAVKFWQNQKVVQEATDDEGKKITRELSHASAWETLVDAGKTRDRSCVGCHSVGFNKPGGYCKTSEVDFREGVQCENCHGPASLHVEQGGLKELVVRGKPGEQTCRGCHHVPHIPTSESFVFNERLKLILGPGHGEEKLKSLLEMK